MADKKIIIFSLQNDHDCMSEKMYLEQKHKYIYEVLIFYNLIYMSYSFYKTFTPQ